MKENRTHYRKPYRVQLTCYRYYNEAGELLHFDHPKLFEVIDVSLGGLGIITKGEFPIDVTLEFTFYLEDIPYQVLSRIKWHTNHQFFNKYGLEIIGHNNMLFRHLQQFVLGQSIIKKDVVQA